MNIEYREDEKPGDKIPGTIVHIEPTEDTGYGTGLKFIVNCLDGNDRWYWTPDVVTPRNRLGRSIVRLMGELRAFETDDLIGMPVTVEYISHKKDAARAVADLLIPRKPGKDEDPTTTVGLWNERQAVKDLEAPF